MIEKEWEEKTTQSSVGEQGADLELLLRNGGMMLTLWPKAYKSLPLPCMHLHVIRRYHSTTVPYYPLHILKIQNLFADATAIAQASKTMSVMDRTSQYYCTTTPSL